MARNEHFIIGLINALGVIFFLGGIFFDYYGFMEGLFVLIAVSVLSNFLRPYLSSPSKKKRTQERVKAKSQTKAAIGKPFCIQCGEKLDRSDDYCPSCGTLNEN